MNSVEVLGFVAGIMTLMIYIPQTVRTVRTRRTRDLSLVAFVMATLSAAMWVIYGAITGSAPLVATNSTVGICSIIITTIKLREKR